MTQKFSAHYVFPVCGPPLRHGIVEVDEEGVIREVTDPGGEVREIARTRFINGVLVPGFVIFLETGGEVSTGSVPGRWGGMLRDLGCRAAVVGGVHQTVFLDLLTGDVEEVLPQETDKLRQRMVVVRMKEKERPGIADLFPGGGRAGGGRGFFEQRLAALTLGGAEALGLTGAGCLAPGYRPGVVALEMEFGKFEVRGREKLDA